MQSKNGTLVSYVMYRTFTCYNLTKLKRTPIFSCIAQVRVNDFFLCNDYSIVVGDGEKMDLILAALNV